MADEYVPTIRIRRPKVTTDERGHSVWAETVQTAQLELVSTDQLKALLESADENTRTAIGRVVSGEDPGVLARDPATGLFEIINDADLQAVLDASEQTVAAQPRKNATLAPASASKTDAGDGGELSLVSTQVLRRILGDESPGKRVSGGDKTGGFDPYNSG